MDISKEMHITLFNELNDAREKLAEAMEILNEIQAQTEEMYISSEE